MTAINHAVTGALIGLIVGQPVVAIPAAFLSHFICDAIPHYGSEGGEVWSTAFKRYLAVEATLCVLLVAALAYRHPLHWLLAAICAFVATSPDLLWIPRFVHGLQHRRKKAVRSRILTFLGADGIQWFQRPIGALVEVAWLSAGLTLLSVFVR